MSHEPESPEHLSDDASVLVVLLNNVRDWETVQKGHWYRIPVKRAPRQVGAEYLAFFHTAAFDELKWGVHYYAPVESMRVMERRRLLPGETDHPRAKELYYRFDLGPLTQLEQPIPSRRLRRVTFIHTSLTRLIEAEDVSELWIKQPLRERLWVEFNRQGIHAEPMSSLREGEIAYQFDFVILCQSGTVAIDCRLPPAEEVEAGIGREESAPYPPTEDEQMLAELNCSWLRFNDPGWPGNLQPYMMQVWKEIEKRGGQLGEPALDSADSP